MTKFTHEERQELIIDLYVFIDKAETECSMRHTAQEIVPEILAALLSVATLIARDRMDSDLEKFTKTCETVAKLVWNETPKPIKEP